MKKYESFNQSGLSRFLNTPAGRLMRITAGLGFLTAGIVCGKRRPSVAAMLWGLVPFSAGLFDVCYISAALGGPISGKEIRDTQVQTND